MPTFLQDLDALTRAAERDHRAFVNAEGTYIGFFQILYQPGRRITLHRIWALKSGQGHGALMMRALCDLADRHAVEIELRALPIGRKPYPMNREQLAAWYERFGFKPAGRKMLRMPVTSR